MRTTIAYIRRPVGSVSQMECQLTDPGKVGRSLRELKMRFYVLLVLLALSTQWVVAEEYVNKAYGIEVRTSGDWRILNSARLQIDLSTLNDKQLDELFDAYNNSCVVGLDNREDAKVARVRIDFDFPRNRFYSALEMAERYSLTRRSQTNAVAATEMEIGGVKGAYCANRVGPKQTTVFHHFIVRRSRSYVVVTAVFSDGSDLETQLSTMKAALANWYVDLKADRRS